MLSAVLAALALAAPNILLISTDNQDARSVVEAMPQTQALLRDQGADFSAAYAGYALCCPSRATLLTGQYAHNHGVLENDPPTGGYAKLDHSNTLPLWLQAAGYRTGHVGKYLNGYGTVDTQPLDGLPACRETPPGWDDWHGLVGGASFNYVKYLLSENGTLNNYGGAATTCPYVAWSGIYLTDRLRDLALQFLTDSAAQQPWYLQVMFQAPVNPRAAARHSTWFASAVLPRPPSFDEADVSDKPAWVQSRPRISESAAYSLQRDYRKRLQALAAVDEAVVALVARLQSTGQLANTLIVFTSDQGWLQGEHRLTNDYALAVPYEEAARVPLYVRGPSIPAGVVRSGVVSLVDLAATFVEAAGAAPGLPQDGRSILPLAADGGIPWRSGVLMEARYKQRYFSALREGSFAYVEYDAGARECYDLSADPWELASIPGGCGSMVAPLASMRGCAGAGCWR